MRSQAFEVEQPAAASDGGSQRREVTVVGRYSDTLLLESGFLKGAELIAGKPAIVEVSLGQGRVVLFGFRVQHRAQPHGTFRLQFNAIQRSVSQRREPGR